MYLELKKKIREYKNTDSYEVEPNNVKKIKLWDYDISLPADSHPFLHTFLSSGEDYSLMSAQPADGKREDPDPFAKECYGDKGVLSSILAAEHVDSDWLNGLLLAQELIS